MCICVHLYVCLSIHILNDKKTLMFQLFIIFQIKKLYDLFLYMGFNYLKTNPRVQDLWANCSIKQCLRYQRCHPKVWNVKLIKWDILNKVVLKKVWVSKSIVIKSIYVLVIKYWWFIHHKINKGIALSENLWEVLKMLTKHFTECLFNFFRFITLLH